MASSIAAHLSPFADDGNSYPQTGHSLARPSMSIAQEGHSFLFIMQDQIFARWSLNLK
jgi:hypothetical protein